jgi:hypothetical protein
VPLYGGSMSFSINTVVSDGVTKQFAITFTNGIYDRSNVHVYVEDDVDGNGAQKERTFTWINDGLIELEIAAPAGKDVTIRREMHRNEPDVNYVDGAILDEANLNQSMDQLLGLIQEIFDGRGISSFNSDLNMNGYRVTNHGAPNEDGDLATLGQVRELVANLNGEGLITVQEESQTGADIVGGVSTLQTVTFTPGIKNLLVFVNGVKVKRGRDYVENSNNTISWVITPNTTADIDFISNVSTTNNTTSTSAVSHVTGGNTVGLDDYLDNPTPSTVTVNGSKWAAGTGTPEGTVAGNVGDIYTRTDGGAGTTLYIKESGTGNTGWVAK